MTKHIDADLLRKDIESWAEAISDNVGDFSDGVRFALRHFTFLLDSLQQEQPKVDLEKDVRTYCCSSFRFNYDELNDSFYSNAFEFDDAVELACHFYKLGLNARKEK